MFVEGVALGLIILLAVEFFLMFTLVVWERPALAALSFAGTIVASDLLFGTNVLGTIWDSPLTILAYAGAYVVAGVAWSFPRWWFYVRKVRDQYLKTLSNYKRVMALPQDVPLSGRELDDWRNSHEARSWADRIPPRASQNKARILTWMMYWPFSLIWTMIDEPFKRTFQYLFEKIRGVYQIISERAFAGVETLDANS